MKIGIITHNFPTTENDRQNAGIFVYDLAKLLSKKTKVVVLAPGPEERIKVFSGIKTYYFKFNDKLGNLKIYNPVHIAKFGNFFIQGGRVLRKFIKQNEDIDFIISMWAFPAGLFAYDAYKLKKIPYAIFALGSDIYFYSKKPILRQLIKKYLNEAKFLIADSPDLSKEVKRLSGKETFFLPSVSNMDFQTNHKKIKSNKINLTFLGRLEKVKGADIFAEALLLLKEDLNEFEINFIGEGSMKNFLKQSLNIYSSIKFWGNLNAKNIANVLNHTDWLIIPSRSDSIPLVFSEAMKFSVPVVVSDLKDLKNLVNKYRVGYVFKSEDSRSLAEILKKIATGDKPFKTFKNNTKRAAKFFDLGKTSDKLLNLIRRYA